MNVQRKGNYDTLGLVINFLEVLVFKQTTEKHPGLKNTVKRYGIKLVMYYQKPQRTLKILLKDSHKNWY